MAFLVSAAGGVTRGLKVDFRCRAVACHPRIHCTYHACHPLHVVADRASGYACCVGVDSLVFCSAFRRGLNMARLQNGSGTRFAESFHMCTLTASDSLPLICESPFSCCPLVSVMPMCNMERFCRPRELEERWIR